MVAMSISILRHPITLLVDLPHFRRASSLLSTSLCPRSILNGYFEIMADNRTDDMLNRCACAGRKDDPSNINIPMNWDGQPIQGHTCTANKTDLVALSRTLLVHELTAIGFRYKFSNSELFKVDR